MAIDTTNLVKFSKGSFAGYQTLVKENKVNNNTVYITQDEGGIYLGGKRLGDYIKVANITALQTLEIKSVDALYYAEAENVLARWDGASWIQINAAGLTDVKDGGAAADGGKVITGLTVAKDATTGAMVLKYTTGTVATAEGLESLQETVDNYGTRLTNVEGVASQNKTDIANLTTALSTGLSDLETELRGGYTGSMSDLNTAVGEAADAAEAAQDTADDAAAAAAAEATRAKGVEANLQSEIDAAEQAIANEVNRATAKENELNDAINGVDDKVDGAIEDIEDLSGKLTAEITRSTNADTQHTTDISNNATAIATEKQRAEGAESALGLRIDGVVENLNGLADDVEQNTADIKKNTDAIAVINGTGEGSIAYAVASILGGAPEGYDTLKEISDWIAAHPESVAALNTAIQENKEAIEANSELIEALQGADTALDGRIDALETAVEPTKGTVDARIEAALVKVFGVASANVTSTTGADYDTFVELVSKLKAVETLASENKTAAEGAQDTADQAAAAVVTEKQRAEGVEADLLGQITAEVTRATNAESALGTRIDGVVTVNNEQADAISANADAIEANQGNITKNAEAIAAEVTRAEGAEADLLGKINAEAERAKDEEERLEGLISDNASNIETNTEDIASILAQLTWGEF